MLLLLRAGLLLAAAMLLTDNAILRNRLGRGPARGSSDAPSGDGQWDSRGGRRPISPVSSGGGDHPDGERKSAPGIPRILHQSWKDELVPSRFHAWQVLRLCPPPPPPNASLTP